MALNVTIFDSPNMSFKKSTLLMNSNGMNVKITSKFKKKKRLCTFFFTVHCEKKITCFIMQASIVRKMHFLSFIFIELFLVRFGTNFLHVFT